MSLVLIAFITQLAWDDGRGVLTLVSCLAVLAGILAIMRYGSRPHVEAAHRDS